MMIGKRFVIAALILLTVQAAAPAWAGSKCPSPRSYTADGNKIQTCWSGKWSGFVSPKCLKSRHSKCGAFELAETAARRPVRLSTEDLRGGKNPGSVLCSKIGGKVVLATGSLHEQVTFCQARDRTLIDCNALNNAYHSFEK